jgi:hypothetical protein
VDLPVGYFSNAYRLSLPSKQTFWRVELTGPKEPRRQIEKRYGATMWLEGRWGYAVVPFAGGTEYECAPTLKPKLVLFGIREALLERARSASWDCWFSMTEFNAVPPDEGTLHGPVLIEPLLKARATFEGVDDPDFFIILSSGVRWRMDGDLTNPRLAEVAVGEPIFQLSGDGPPRGTVARVDGNDLYLTVGREMLERPVAASDYSLVGKPSLVHRYLERDSSDAEAATLYRNLLIASGTLMSGGSPNQYAVKQRYQETERLLGQFDRTISLPAGGEAVIDKRPVEILLKQGTELQAPDDGASRWVGAKMNAPRLRFGQGVPSRSAEQAYAGLRRFGAFNLHDFPRDSVRFLFVYPKVYEHYVGTLREKLFNGLGNYPGFADLFGLPEGLRIEQDTFPIEFQRREDAPQAFRDGLEEWARTRQEEPDIAVVIHPHTERWDTDSAYYEAKAFFGRQGIATQMVTTELLRDDKRVGWSLANIALGSFAKLGGMPWVVDARGDDSDLVIGVGRADIKDGDGRRRIFGYAVAFISSGAYLDIASFAPATDQTQYQNRLTQAIAETLSNLPADAPPDRIVIHLAKRTGQTEIDAAMEAIKQSQWDSLPVAFLRVDDSSLFEFMDGSHGTYAAPKGLAVQLTTHRALVQTEGPSNLGPARRPLLLELDTRSTVPADQLGRLTRQVFRLAHANWRGFNARSKPVTLFYGEQLAELAGYVTQATGWDPATLKPELRRRPWFL